MYNKGDIFLYIVIGGGLVIIISEFLQPYPSWLTYLAGLCPIVAAILRMRYDRRDKKE